MGKLVFGMMQSLDGYIAGPKGELRPPGPLLHQHFNDHVRNVSAILYGTRTYELMRYWDVDQPDWEGLEHDFADAWRSKPKWVASHSLKAVGPNATLIQGDVCEFAARLKAQHSGEIDVAGAELANTLSAAGLIDEYRLYFRPYVLGSGKPYFAGPVPALRLLKHETIGEDAVRIIYLPA